MAPLPNSRSFLRIVVVVCWILAAARTADAGVIIDLGTAGCTGVVCGPLTYPDGLLTLTADGGTFTSKTRNGATGLGISGKTRGEIDVNEFVRGSFSSPVAIDALTILFLYNGGEFNDPNEIAQISINGGAVLGTLIANAENSAVWSLGGGVTSCGDTSITGTGCFRIANPFASTFVSEIAFTALSAGNNLANDSDFSLGSIEVATAPEPAALLLLGAAALGLVARRRPGSR